jgi:TRAP-type C4-dicarboxylate transport system permease small subunit
MTHIPRLAVEDFIGSALLLFTLVLLATEIVMRYIFASSLIWSDELARLCLVTLAWLGCATGFRKRCHVRIDVIDHLLAPRALRLLGWAVDAIVLLYLLAIAWLAWRVSGLLWSSPTAALGLPGGLIYVGIVAGTLLGAYRLVLSRIPDAGTSCS